MELSRLFSAMRYLHDRYIAHCDISMENILVTKDSCRDVVKSRMPTQSSLERNLSCSHGSLFSSLFCVYDAAAGVVGWHVVERLPLLLLLLLLQQPLAGACSIPHTRCRTPQTDIFRRKAQAAFIPTAHTVTPHRSAAAQAVGFEAWGL